MTSGLVSPVGWEGRRFCLFGRGRRPGCGCAWVLFLVVAFVVVADVESGGGFEAVSCCASFVGVSECKLYPVDFDVEQGDCADSFKCKGLSQGKIGATSLSCDVAKLARIDADCGALVPAFDP